AAGRRRVAGPGDRGPQRWRIGGAPTFPLDGRPPPDMTIETDPERWTAQPYLEPRAFAVERRREIVEAQAHVDRLAAPCEPAGRDEAFGNRRPRKRHLDIGEALRDAPRLVANFDRAVRDADLGERHGRLGGLPRGPVAAGPRP